MAAKICTVRAVNFQHAPFAQGDSPGSQKNRRTADATKPSVNPPITCSSFAFIMRRFTTMTASASGILSSAILWKRNRIRTPAARWLGHFAGLCLITLTTLLGGCASGPALVDHAFGFNAGRDSPGYEVLAYRYGDGRGVARSSDVPIRQFGRSNQWTGINGPMPLGDTLYVKWRNKATDQVFEKSIGLRPLLPKDMTRKEVYFVVSEGEVFVYLKDFTRYAKLSDPIVGPSKVQLFVTGQIHP